MTENERLCYFAHHTTDYGTDREQAAIEVIERQGFEVVNPNSPEDEAAYQALKARRENPMAHFEAVVRKCGALAFQRFESGEIGAGVGKEIMTAVEDDKPVYEVVGDQLVSVNGAEAAASAMSVEDTKKLLSEIRAGRAPKA